RWLRRVDSYSVKSTLNTLRAAFDAPQKGLRVVLSDNECRLAEQRRDKQKRAVRLKAGKSVINQRFGVDEEVCSGDHSCMRLSGCPSLTLRPSFDPLKDGPAAMVDNSCVACGLCGEAAHAATLCPSFYRATAITNAGPIRTAWARLGSRLVAGMGAS
ncbi:MAG: indolepyruvate ferredoxin oxidoreductase, partial [Boseongicola sp.]